MLRLGEFVARRWWLVLAFWAAVVVALRLSAPDWDSVAHDGDFAYLPDRSPSVQGESLLRAAFPYDHAKSQLVVVVSRPDQPLEEDDILLAYDVARRMKSLHGAAAVARLWRFEREAELARRGNRTDEAAALGKRADLAREEAELALDEAVYFDQQLAEFRGDAGQAPATPLAAAYWNRAVLRQHLGQSEAAAEDRQRALALDRGLGNYGRELAPRGLSELPILDVWTWRDSLFGGKLISADRQARLIVLRLDNEFLAVRNQELLRVVRGQLDAVRATLGPGQRGKLSLDLSGSAAVGGDMLLSAKESIQNTDLFAILLILLILVVVYRAPILIAVPLISIAVALSAATNLVAWLASMTGQPGVPAWWDVKVFTTTKIFIVVILYGAGTDFCLFLIARFREECARTTDNAEATARALAGVGDALLASALTTIVGLAMMFFAEFGKFRHSGPVIGLCLAITLLVCLTLTPALLRLFGAFVFWPLRPLALSADPVRDTWAESWWRWVGRAVIRRPGLVLAVVVVGLMPLAIYGWQHDENVTYDVLAGLDPLRPSRQGAVVMRRHFPVGEAGPLTVVVSKPGVDFRSEAGRRALYDLTRGLYDVEGVGVVRSLVDPLGEFPPGTRIGLTNRRAWATWLARPHRKTEAVFVGQTPQHAGNLTRLDVVLQHDPFSRQAIDVLRRLDQRLREFQADASSFWRGAQLAYAGPTASVRDLREVTLEDRRRIELLVAVAVYAALVGILRRPVISVYLILTVLFTYLVTLGITVLFFSAAYGATYQGLDWKVPLFLFVILVAVGQDYNVYFVTRVWEEQRRRGWFAGMLEAVARTGGIITSCGLIMAGSFAAMTSVAWGELVPASWTWLRDLLGTGGGLRAMVELGFALSLGVTIDTMIVRTLVVPAFLALVDHFSLRTISFSRYFRSPATAPSLPRNRSPLPRK